MKKSSAKKSAVNSSTTKKFIDQKDYWGTHVLQNIYASTWCEKTLSRPLADVYQTIEKSNNVFELQAAIWTLLKLGNWFNKMFDLKDHYKLAIKKTEEAIAKEEKIFEDFEDHKSFLASINEQLKQLQILKKENEHEF